MSACTQVMLTSKFCFTHVLNDYIGAGKSH